MLTAFLSLDLEPLVRGTGVISMITLTLPPTWEVFAPTGSAWALLLRKFWQRFDRAFPGQGAALVKSEFQRRGAPHAHILMSAPLGQTVQVGKGVDRHEAGFIEWLSLTWADVVGAVGDERVAHERAGTQVKPWSWSGPQPIAGAVAYFAKYTVKSGGAARHYQDQPPDVWLQPGAGLARVWSYRGLVRATSEALVTDAEALWAQRVLRRWHRAKGETARVRVVRGQRRRWLTRRVRRLRARGGWLAVPNARVLADEVRRAATMAAGSGGSR